MIVQDHIHCFSSLGNLFSAVAGDKNPVGITDAEALLCFNIQISDVEAVNPWFTKENIFYALSNWAKILTNDNLQQWLEKYDQKSFDKRKKIGVVMAGNIPMVGFHDMLSILITGNTFIGKLSSKDDLLLKAVSNYLILLNPEYSELIVWEDKKLTGIDAIIATGSDNTSRYFEYYFGKYPHIIRKNRNSVAILSGNETAEDFKALAEDIFVYFGLGCRNVSKLYIPEGYDFGFFFRSIEHWNHIANHNKYANNHEYNRAIYLVNMVPHLDNGFLLLKESNSISSPISVMFYEFYTDFENLKERINFNIDKTQCIVGAFNIVEGQVGFGESQHPQLWDYADNVDTIEFILSL